MHSPGYEHTVYIYIYIPCTAMRGSMKFSIHPPPPPPPPPTEGLLHSPITTIIIMLSLCRVIGTQWVLFPFLLLQDWEHLSSFRSYPLAHLLCTAPLYQNAEWNRRGFISLGEEVATMDGTCQAFWVFIRGNLGWCSFFFSLSLSPLPPPLFFCLLQSLDILSPKCLNVC